MILPHCRRVTECARNNFNVMAAVWLCIASFTAAGCRPPHAPDSSSSPAPSADEQSEASEPTDGDVLPAADAASLESVPPLESEPAEVVAQPSELSDEDEADGDEADGDDQAWDQQRAGDLYVQHCAGCHGPEGNGQGVAASFLFPKPRDFRAGRFRLVSTVDGVVTRADVEAVIERGMPGSSMPPWAHLAESDRLLLAEQVLELRRQGARDVELEIAAEDEEELSEEDLAELVASVTTPGDPIEVPPLGEPSADVIEAGKQLYLTKGCASCHGTEGKGDGQEKMVDAEGLPTRPRDLTLGIYKGDPDAASIYQRLAVGMPGSPMPASQGFSPEDLASMVHFVRSLSDEATRESTVMRRTAITAERGEVPRAPTSELWDGAAAMTLRTIPLWWRDEADPYVTVAAVHDGEALSVRLSWSDDAPDTAALRSETFQDAAAVELYRGDVEPFLGMGSAATPVDVWMWGGDRSSATPQHVEDANPRMVVDVYPLTETVVDTAKYERPGTQTDAQEPLSLTALAAGNAIVPRGDIASAAALDAAGPGSLTFRIPTSRHVEVRGEYQDGRWHVELTRPLAVDSPDGGVALTPGEQVSLAVAIWNGALRDRDGQKRITIWHDLKLAP